MEILVLSILLAADRPCSPSAPPAALLQCAQDAYQYGDCKKALALLREPIERGTKWPSRADEVEALRVYGICLHLTGRRQAARLVFQRLLEKDDTVHLDPHLVPPEVVQTFRAVRRGILARRLARMKRLPRPSWFWNFLPPAGQIQNGQYWKAGILGAGELLFFGLNLASYLVLTNPRYRQDGSFVRQASDGQILEDHRTLAKVMMGLNYASFALLVGTVVYGIVDGWLVMRARQRALRRKMEFLRRQMAGDPAGALLTWTF